MQESRDLDLIEIKMASGDFVTTRSQPMNTARRILPHDSGLVFVDLDQRGAKCVQLEAGSS